MHSGGLRSHTVERNWQVQKDLGVKRKWKTTQRGRPGRSGWGSVPTSIRQEKNLSMQLGAGGKMLMFPTNLLYWLTESFWQSWLSIWYLGRWLFFHWSVWHRSQTLLRYLTHSCRWCCVHWQLVRRVQYWSLDYRFYTYDLTLLKKTWTTGSTSYWLLTPARWPPAELISFDNNSAFLGQMPNAWFKLLSCEDLLLFKLDIFGIWTS